MLNTIRANIRNNISIVNRNCGSKLAIIVGGSEEDKDFWFNHFQEIKGSVFREDKQTYIYSVHETVRKGNFLGTLNAWKETLETIANDKYEIPNVSIMNMVFGQGQRLSPFTQALNNRKSSFPLPIRTNQALKYMCTADISNLYTNMWVEYLDKTGFRGIIVKWGDEAIIPGKSWNYKENNQSVDAVRFIWQTEITDQLAREKEWVIFEKDSYLMKHQLTRQEPQALRNRVAELSDNNSAYGVNLGSLAVSYEFLDIAMKVFDNDIFEQNLWVDWDPYIWIALTCKNEEAWMNEKRYEEQTGQTGIEKLEKRYPDFYSKINIASTQFEEKMGRPFKIKVLDFGQAFWTDIGLHKPLRERLESLTQDSDYGMISRELFQIPESRDSKGNILINSTISNTSNISNSVIIDSEITDNNAVVNEGVIYGSKINQLEMPYGGCVINCILPSLKFLGPDAIAFNAIDTNVVLEKGGRQTTLLAPSLIKQLISNEGIIDYKNENFTESILGNSISFDEASRIMSKTNYNDSNKIWHNYWHSFTI